MNCMCVRRRGAFAVSVLLAACNGWGSAFEVRVVRGTGTDEPDGYRPPLISNGELSLPVHHDGGWTPRRYYQYDTDLVWQGRRTGESGRPLIPQGRLNAVFEIDGKSRVPTRWEQAIDIARAVCHCRNVYDGVKTESSFFIPFEANVVAVRLTCENVSDRPRSVRMGLVYREPASPFVRGAWREPAAENVLRYDWNSYGPRVWQSAAELFAGDGGGTVRSLDLAVGETRTVDVFAHFVDTCEDGLAVGRGLTDPKRPKSDVEARLKTVRARLRQIGWEGLFTEHAAAWKAYYDESSVSLPDARLEKMWEMANYHLRCNATKWSFPTGVFNSHWRGNYFAFDEMFPVHGLASSGHFDTALRCPEYRKATLETACARNRHYRTKGRYGARWVWQTDEEGRDEMTSQGFWIEHIFHMANVARSCWVQYLYGGDRDYLAETGYPVILECARYFRNCATYVDSNGLIYIGKFTDLERLGPARERAYMTTCGAVYSLEVAAEAAERLGLAGSETADFRETARRLRDSLPVKDGRYLPYPDATEGSVGALSGFFPYPVFRSDATCQRATVDWVFANATSFGNMYPVGKRICPWYAGWMSAVASVCGNRADAFRYLAEAWESAGCFGEYFEINEDPRCYGEGDSSRRHPWFSTGAGNCLYAINQLLVCDADDETRVAFTVPEAWRDFAFRLPCQRACEIACEVRAGKVTRFDVRPLTAEAPELLTLVFRPEILSDVIAKSSHVRRIDSAPNRILVAWCLSL